MARSATGFCGQVRQWAVALAMALAGPAAAWAGAAPVVPCAAGGPAPFPAYSVAPEAQFWHVGDLAGWASPGCLGWPAGRFNVLTALGARFDFAGSVDDLLARFGAQSAWRGLQYVATSQGQWATLVTEASALTSAPPRQRRRDFTPAEMRAGADLYFEQKDNRSADAVTYRLRVVQATDTRLVVRVDNVSDISMLLFTLFSPGDLESTYFFDKLGPDEWGYYSMWGAHERVFMIGNHEASYVNRATAIFRYLAGIPTGQQQIIAQ